MKIRYAILILAVLLVVTVAAGFGAVYFGQQPTWRLCFWDWCNTLECYFYLVGREFPVVDSRAAEGSRVTGLLVIGYWQR